VPRTAKFTLTPATEHDIPALAALHNAVAAHLTTQYGIGPWSATTSEKWIRYALRISQIFVVRLGPEIVGTFRLTTRKPWAIDTTFFTPVKKPLYLLAMAVPPHRQRRGLGTRCLKAALKIARAWPADAIRLDAYDAPAGAGTFYAKSGWTATGRTTYRRAKLIYYERLLKP
jgi:GNAT superfamily N-acetyltransferase